MIDLLNLGNTYVKYYKLIFGQYFKLPFLLGGGGGNKKPKTQNKTKQEKNPKPVKTSVSVFTMLATMQTHGSYGRPWRERPSLLNGCLL